jgi:HEPN domain-containing protein
MLSTEPPLTGDTVFHAQQLAEKSFKAFLSWHDEPFRKTHNLAEIGQQCAAIDHALAQVVLRAEALTDYAWKYRYPGSPGEPSLSEARSALAVARDV